MTRISVLALRQIMADSRELENFVATAYTDVEWPDCFLFDDMRILREDEHIKSIDGLRRAIEGKHFKHTDLSPVTIDVLTDALGIECKKRPFNTDNFERCKEYLGRVRITSSRVLQMVSKKTWKRLRVPAGIKVEMEDISSGRPVGLCPLTNESKVVSISGDRMVILDGGKHYNVDRFCPHKGSDLALAHVKQGVLTCPRHKWRFNLEAGGICLEHGGSINAQRLDW